jgi:acetyl-CoA acetyltransferase
MARFTEISAPMVQDALDAGVPSALTLFGGAGREHMQRYGTKLETFAKIRAKASRHAANNPLAVFRTVVTEEDVMNEKVMWPGVMTRSMACPPTSGAAAAIVCTEAFEEAQHPHRCAHPGPVIDHRRGAELRSTVDDRPGRLPYGRARREGRVRGGRREPSDIQVCELHDCFAHNELLTYESLGFAKIGEAEKMVLDGDNTYGGKVVINPSGGLLSKGHPLGATGLAQCYELTRQIRGTAETTQVERVQLALQHNLASAAPAW